MILDLKTIDDIKNYIFINLRGSGMQDSDNGWFDVALNNNEIESIIDDTLRYFIEWKYNGLIEGVYVLQCSGGVTDYDIPKNIYSMPYQYNIDTPDLSFIVTEDIRSSLFYSGYNNIYGYGTYDNFKSYIYQMNTVIADARRLFNAVGGYIFNWFHHTIHLEQTPQENSVKIFKVYYSDALGTNGPLTDYGEIFNDIQVRKYMLALAKMKLGWNLLYVKGINVPNFSIDGAAIYELGKTDLDKIQEEIMENNNLTVFSIG